ncbi:hypothetical protein MWU78_17345 [Arenibacter sp. F26102]|uniref:hypothetical protein n=1 Tax=Arenibacter sp. F26102 TaxID=2926416 RepID=UPI001FF6F7BB|nr:hypothetical protein [Arenibacter sp. F26102]MCK0147424.1 hypothetical protein [Arenibacter sp. F26102]
MKKNNLLVFITVFWLSIGYTQEEDANLILSYPEESEITFFQYPGGTYAKAVYKSQADITNEYPEQLLESIVSATDQEWVNYNTLGGAEKASEKKQSHFDKIITMDKDKNYFELAHKLTFDVGGISTAIVKFFTHFEGTAVLSGAVVMQFVNDRWQKTSHPSLSTLSIIVMRMKSEVLEGIVLQNSNDPNIKAIAERVSTEAGLDLSLLEEEFGSWYSPEIDETKIELYKDPRTW